MFFFGGEKKHEAKGEHCWGERQLETQRAVVYLIALVMWLPLHGKSVLFCGLEHLGLIFKVALCMVVNF